MPINHLGRYKTANAPVVVIDAEHRAALADLGRDRLDASSPARPTLEIHPAVNFTSGHRYIVALRNLKNADKQTPAGARRLPHLPRQPALRRRKGQRNGAPHFEEIFSTLRSRRHRSARACTWPGTSRSPATKTTPAASSRCATTRSRRSATPTSPTASSKGRSPTFDVTETENEPNPGEIARRVKGTFTVPCYLFPSCAPGGTMLLDAERHADRKTASGRPTSTASSRASATTGAGESARPVALRARPVRRRRRGRLGPAAEPLAEPRHRPVRDRRDRHVRIGRPVARSRRLQNLSAFPKLTDRLQQGLLDELYLGPG